MRSRKERERNVGIARHCVAINDSGKRLSQPLAFLADRPVHGGLRSWRHPVDHAESNRNNEVERPIQGFAQLQFNLPDGGARRASIT
jgi:hypothetical protein